MKEITSETIRKLFETRRYNRDTGLFTYINNHRRFKKDDISGNINNRGYVAIKIDGLLYYAHRLAWFIEHGENPDKIDHIDRNKTNNAISNLRNVSSVQNSQNRSISNTNTSGITGVTYKKNNRRWYASIWVNKKQIHLLSSKRKEDAVEARRKAEIEYGFIGE